MKNSIIQKTVSAILFLFFCNVSLSQEQIGVAAAVNKNTVDLTPEERSSSKAIKLFKTELSKPSKFGKLKCYF